MAYGLFFCTTAKDRLDLKDVYKRLFPIIDLMDLHRSCLAGELYAFTKRHINVDARFESLMKNIDPCRPPAEERVMATIAQPIGGNITSFLKPNEIKPFTYLNSLGIQSTL